jgi:hypothetical protein
MKADCFANLSAAAKTDYNRADEEKSYCNYDELLCGISEIHP